MLLDSVLWLALAVKMAVTAIFVIVATFAAERGGPLFGALIATLPILAAPAYVFLALDHDAAFIAQSALGSMAINAVNGVYALAFAVLAQRFRLSVIMAMVLALWIGLALAVRSVEWTLAGTAALNLMVLPLCLWLGRRFRHAVMPAIQRRWYDLVARALLVALLVAVIVTLSFRIGPTGSGVLAMFPIVLTSVYVILHRRVGGQAAGAVLANSVSGLVGLGFATAALNLTAVPLGVPAALALALAISIGWNLLVWATRRRFSVP